METNKFIKIVVLIVLIVGIIVALYLIIKLAIPPKMVTGMVEIPQTYLTPK